MDLHVVSRGIFVIAEKNIRLYYTLPPVLMFGILFPFFMFLAFFIGRPLDLPTVFPGFLAMMMFFTASSVGPIITPWEKREKTYERLLSYPLSLWGLILGDILAGCLFGIIITVLAWMVSMTFLHYSVNAGIIAVAFVLGTVTSSALGTLIASCGSDSPPNVMILSNLIRFPLIFISGVFIQLKDLHGWGLLLANCSPLTYLVDLFNAAFTGVSIFSPLVDGAVLIGFFIGFIMVARFLQNRNLTRGM